ncbi:hypothetical protein GCM10022215_42310 [Nocardioides fonticola]|uniref:PASTA domain-containing protein n=1 Tax=Nocardioides fonticola TaxID=450363 RepID=A0ABP7Y227_9ACTN
MTRLPLVVLLAVVALGATACSDDTDAAGADSGASASSQPAIDAVSSIAPQLESAVRSETYPMTLEEAVARIDELGLTPAAPLQVAGYRYDADQVEFTLCVEDADSGAYATYNTAPMSVRQAGDSGGCASADLTR